MANAFYNRGASFNPDELADGDAIEAEFDSVGRGFDTIEDLVNANKAGYPSQTFHVATATTGTHAVPKAQMDAEIDQINTALGLKLSLVNYTATDVLNKLKTVDGSGSGVDADLLDGQHGSYYRDASNINTGTLAKERLPASIDASTTGNASTASKVVATAPLNGDTDLVAATMGGNDFFRIRVGGNNNTGWTEIATADDGNEPIHVRQYTGYFASIARTLTLLDSDGVTRIPQGLCMSGCYGSDIAAPGVAANGLMNGNGDNCNQWTNNLKLTSWWGLGFSPSISGQPVPYGEYSHWFNVRNGDMGVRGTITAPQLNGNAATASKLLSAITLSLSGGASGSVLIDGSTNVTLNVTISSDSAEVGKVTAFARSSAPSGYLKCNGAAISRTTYAALFSVIGTTYGAGDGSTTFNVPDLRGEFIRGWDDARGVDSGRVLGSWQDGQNLWHGHGITINGYSHNHWWGATTSTNGNHQHGTGMYSAPVGNGSSIDQDEVKGNGGGGGYATSWNGNHTHDVSGWTSTDSHGHSASIDGSGGNEVRVRNKALLYCIKY